MPPPRHNFREERLPEAEWEALEELETWRRGLRARVLEGKRLLGTAGLVALLWFFAMRTMLPGDGLFLAVVVPLLSFLAMCFLVDARHFKVGEADYRREFKGRAAAVLRAALTAEIRPEPEPALGRDWCAASRLFATRPDRLAVADLCAGRRRGVALKFCEIEAGEKRRWTDGKGRKKSEKLDSFRGILLLADFERSFGSSMTVMPAAGRYFSLLDRKSEDSGGILLRPENAAFREKFVARAPETADGRHLLTPPRQSALLDLRSGLGVDFRLSLHDSRLWLAFPQECAWFAGDWKKRADDRVRMREVLARSRACLQLVNDLDSGTRLWTNGE